MVTTEERIKILKMVQDGKLSAEEAAQLIEALEGSTEPVHAAAGGQSSSQTPGSGKPARWFRVQVTDLNSGRTRVNVRLPVGLVSAGVKMGAKFSPEVQGLDLENLMQYIQSGTIGQVVDVVDDKDGEHVQVFIE